MKHLPPIHLVFLLIGLFSLKAEGQFALLNDAESPPPAKHDHHAHAALPLSFVPNHRQWDDRIAYASELGGLNKLFLETDRFTFVLFDPEKSAGLHGKMQEVHTNPEDLYLDGHAYSVRFNGAQQPVFSTAGDAPHHLNFLLGNDPSRWAPHVPLHEKVIYNELYPGVNLEAYSHGGNFKYDFVVQPGGKPELISLSYEGLDGLRIANEELVLATSVGELRELRPYAYQTFGGKQVPIACRYVLNGSTVSFELPEGYDAELPLVIDPTVVGATLAGSNGSESFGHSATSDNAGNMYGAGISFGVGYPTMVGAFQRMFAGGTVDIVISKYNPTGTAQLYATYVGGNDSEHPHSMIVDASGQLSFYGTTASINYPVTTDAVQQGLRGGTDIVVTKLNPDGSALVGSTYLGGADTDGVNFSPNNLGNGDQYRGEIVLDAAGNIYVATCTSSEDFPITPNAFQTERGAVGQFVYRQDGVIFKLNSDLSTVFWATYLGGSGSDLASSLRVDDENNVYVSGFAAADDFPMVASGVSTNWPGGDESAFIVKISADGSQILNGTYWGTSENDRSYFLDLDELDQVHVFGLSQGDMLVTPGVYSSGVSSNQFISGFTADLSQVIYSTVIGSPSGSFANAEFYPVAFMVDKCNGIYISGHGSGPNLPLTGDAIYTEDNSFYLAKLEPDATALTFGSYYGRANHVDGGTSRFDKGGVVYQGVCSCTDGDRVMVTTDDAWRENQFTRCDIGVFKIDFDVDVVTAQGVAAPSTSGCAPLTIDFTYTGRDAQTISWDFGTGGDTGSGENITYTFEEAGSYTVTQIATSPTSCNPTDTFFLQIEVLDENSTVTNRGFCEGVDITFLDASTPGATYVWQDGTTGATYQPDEAGTYWVDVSVEGCTRRDTFLLVPINELAVDLGEDLLLCDSPGFTLDASNTAAISYFWQDGSTQPTLFVEESGFYGVRLVDANGCTVQDDLRIDFNTPADIELGNDFEICQGTSTSLDATAAGASYRWQDGSTGATLTVEETGLYRVDVLLDGCPSSDSIFVTVVPAPDLEISGKDRLCPQETDGSLLVTPTGGGNTFVYEWDTGENSPARNNLPPGLYTVIVSNETACTTTVSREIIETDSIDFTGLGTFISCENDQSGSISITDVTGGTAPYNYSILGGPLGDVPLFEGLGGGTYTLTVRDSIGCQTNQDIVLFAPRNVVVDAGADAFIDFGDSTRLRASVNLPDGLLFTWTPALDLNCTDCLEPFASPLSPEMVYTLSVLDEASGCVYSDSLTVRVSQDRNVYLPNAFSPNGDGINDRFFVNADRSVQQVNFLRIFGRWGQLLFERENFSANDPASGWDGLANGKPLDGQVVVYTMEVTFLDGMTRKYEGSLTLLR